LFKCNQQKEVSVFRFVTTEECIKNNNKQNTNLVKVICFLELILILNYFTILLLVFIVANGDKPNYVVCESLCDSHCQSRREG